jgi:CheY-like chemotaxis protein
MTAPATGTVLIVEDEALIAMDLALSLESAGYAVLGPYKSADLALDALERERPDIALLDLNLGRGLTSEIVAERLRALNLPFVFLTGYAMSSHPVIERFSEAGCLSKPVSMPEVASMVSKSLVAAH